ncbi:MAG: VOC family protein, partial [Actinomycetota bacterium]
MDQPIGPPALRTLDYTMLLCRQIAPMRRFYAEVLGLRIRREVADRYVELEVGSTTLALRLRSRSYDGPPPADGVAAVQLAFRVPPADVDAAARCRAA